MAGQNHLLTHLIDMLSGFDEAALIALANKGLYRRARKDLEKGTSISIGDSTDAGLLIQVAEFTVTLPESGPGQASCSCPAPGVCRHILSACLFLQQSAPPDDETQTSEERTENPPKEDRSAQMTGELLAFSHETLRKWAGTKEFREALKLVVTEGDAELQTGNPLLLRLPQSGLEGRYPTGGGLEGWIVKGPSQKRKRIIVAAILLFQKEQGRPLPAISEGNERQELLDATRSREEMLAAVQRLLEEAVTVGLAHLSPALRERTNSLSISARGFKFYSLSLELSSIAKAIDLQLARSAQADSESLFTNMNRTFALCEALQQPGSNARIDLLGAAKSQYDSVARLDLLGVGAYPWRTRSNYRGLTLLFWDNDSKRIFSWSDARPEQNAARFNPVTRYSAESPWQGGDSPKLLSRSAITLLDASRNPQNRLSSSPKTQCIRTGSTTLGQLDLGERLFTNWKKLLEYSQKLVPIGLKRMNPLDEVVFIKPTAWGARQFEPVEQMFSWIVEDEEGRGLPLALPHSDLTEAAIHYLEDLKTPKKASRVLTVKIVRSSKDFFLWPYTIIKPLSEGENLFNIALDKTDNPKKKKRRKIPTLTEQRQSEEDDQAENMQLFGNQLDRHFAALEQQLNALAERGIKQFSETDQQFFQRQTHFFQCCGLSSLAATLQAFIDDPEQRPRRLLNIAYITELHRQAAAAL